jgi:hypothetical protein
MQPLWKPAQPQSEQRQLIPPGSFFLFLPRLFGKTILAELHSGQRSILPSIEVVSTDSQKISNRLDDRVHGRNQVIERVDPQPTVKKTGEFGIILSRLYGLTVRLDYSSLIMLLD